MKTRIGTVLMGSAIAPLLFLNLSFAKAQENSGLTFAQEIALSTNTQFMIINRSPYDLANAASTATEITNAKLNAPESEKAVTEKLSYRYQVSQTITRQLRQELKSWQEVSTALVIAQKSKEKADHILTLKLGGLEWDRIMESYTLNKNDVRDEVISVMREIEEWQK